MHILCADMQSKLSQERKKPASYLRPGTIMNLKREETEALRALAHEYMEIASLPIQREKMELWKAFNRHDNTRPMVLIDQLPWNELNRDGELTCLSQDPFLRGAELQLRETIYKWKHFPADMVVEPFLTIPYSATNSGCGIRIDEDVAMTDATNSVVSHAYKNQLNDEEDLEKIQSKKITLNREQSAEWLETAKYIFDGILPVRQAGGVTIHHLGIWDSLAMFMGVEDIYFDLMDRPEFIHKIMEKMTDSYLAGIRQVNELGLFDTSANTCHCSVIYNDEQLPDFGAGQGNDTHHGWAFGMAQLFTSVSPDVTAEFEVPYISRMAEEFQMIYYGCCDRLDDRLDIVQKIPKVRKMSCSPWSDREAFAERLRKDIIMSNKPTPAYLAVNDMNYDEIAADLKRTCNAAKKNGVALEMILKDISTVRYQPERLTKWAECAMKVVESY